jgi:hypothetical protein
MFAKDEKKESATDVSAAVGKGVSPPGMLKNRDVF